MKISIPSRVYNSQDMITPGIDMQGMEHIVLTHAGVFHADDAMACAIVATYMHHKYPVTNNYRYLWYRTRNTEAVKDAITSDSS